MTVQARSRKVPRLGDILELPTPKGLAYVQYTHQLTKYGDLLRVLPGVYDARPPKFATLAQQRERFVLLFPLGAAVRQEIMAIVSNEEIPEASRALPVFRRRGAITPGTSNVEWWLIQDGDRSWRVDQLTDEQRDLPILGIWNDTLLIERIVSGWAWRCES